MVTLDIEFERGEAVVNYYLKLSDEAGECSGSSEHSRLNPAGGRYANGSAERARFRQPDHRGSRDHGHEGDRP